MISFRPGAFRAGGQRGRPAGRSGSRRPLIGRARNRSRGLLLGADSGGRGDRPGCMRGHGRRRPSGARAVAAQQRGAGARSCEVPCRSDCVRRVQPGRDEIGFAFPKEERAALVAARPDVFFLPRESELRFHWIEAWLDALDADEMRELVLDAWRMVVPQRVAREVLGPPAAGHQPGGPGSNHALGMLQPLREPGKPCAGHVRLPSQTDAIRPVGVLRPPHRWICRRSGHGE